MVETVRVEFNPPRSVRTVKKSYFMTADGCEKLQLPVKDTDIEWAETPDGQTAIGATIPRWLAEDRGLVEAVQAESDVVQPMSRHDWMLLGTTMALLIRGYETRDAVWEAEKVVERMMGDE